MLPQAKQSPPYFTTQRSSRTEFHFRKHRSRAWIVNRTKRPRNGRRRDIGTRAEFAKFRDSLSRRECRVETSLNQFRVVRIDLP
jgi:hypothetical protein